MTQGSFGAMSGRVSVVCGLILITGCAPASAMEAKMDRGGTAVQGQALSSRLATVEEVFGLWMIRATDGEERCRVALSQTRSGNRHEALVERCDVEALRAVRGWRPIVGGFELLGADNQGLGRFRLTGLDSFEAVDGRFRGERTPDL